MLESTCCQGEDEDKLRILTAMEAAQATQPGHYSPLLYFSMKAV